MTDDFTAISRTLDNRYSCRGYLEQEVDERDIKEIVAVASRVPTWCNAQPWQVLVTKPAATRAFAQILTQAAKTTEMVPDYDWPVQYTGIYQDRRRACGYQLYESLGIEREDRERRGQQMMENFRFFGAPHVAIITTDADLGPYGAMDSGGFIALFALAARAKGIASVVQASVTGYAPVIREHFGIPKNRLIQTAITFGFEDPEHPANGFRTERAAVDDVVTIV
jgi:nitroreductase